MSGWNAGNCRHHGVIATHAVDFKAMALARRAAPLPPTPSGLFSPHADSRGELNRATFLHRVAAYPLAEVEYRRATRIDPAIPEAWEGLGLWCGRSEGAETPTVVCEFSSSQLDDFAFYVLKRDGQGILESADRSNGHFYDTAAPTGPVTYRVYVLDTENNWVGSSETVTLPAIPTEGEGEGS